MEIYILDNKNLNILSVCRPCKYNLNLDEETNGKSEIVLPNLNYAKKGFYLVLNGLYKQFLFVIDDVITSKEEKAVTVSLLDISNIFDRKIILRDKENMLTNGIENYIANEMDRNFINSSDSILNLNYVDVYVHSTTRANVTINDEDNLYNFHTYLINCRQYKNIYTEFKFEGIANRRLKIDIENKSESTMLIDTTLAEVTGYNKVYEVDPVTKVEAYVRENGSVYNLYLKTDRTTTTNKNDVNRLEGRIETISCDTLENAQEEALNVIRANTYKHLVEFNIAKSSKLIDVKNLHIGRPIKIKTQDSIYDSYISAIILSDENFVQYKTGNLRIDFTDKQKLQKRSGVAGTKLDVSGGNVTGVLKVQGKEVVTQENAVAISSTQPSTEEKVWFKKGKNLCKGNFSNGTISIMGVSKRLFTYQNIELKAGVQYTFSTNMNLSTYKYAITYSTNKFPTSSTEYDSGWQTTSSFTFTPTVNGYLGIGIAKTDGTSELSPTNISSYNFQVEQGSTATSYEAYIEKEILVKDNIGSFGKFILDNSMNFLGLVSNAMDPSIKMGFGQYNKTTENVANGLYNYGSVIFLPIADSTHIGHVVILIGNYNATKGRIAIRSYINNNWEQAWSYLATTE